MENLRFYVKNFNPPASVLVLMGVLGFVIIIALQVWTFSSNQKSELLPEVTAYKGPVSAKWVWNSGANKPLLQLGDEPIVEISGWESEISVNGREPVKLWNHNMGANAIGDSLYATFSRPDEYLLEQQVILGDDNSATVHYYFTPLRRVDSVELRLGHYKWWWNNASVDDNVFEGTAAGYRTRITFGSFFRGIEFDRRNDQINFFDAYFRTTNIGERTLIAAEAIEFGES